MVILIFNIVIVLLIINILLTRNSKQNVLACGLIGFSAYEGKMSDTTKLSILMLANVKRGTHASGMYYGDEIIKDSEIIDVFLSNNKIKKSNVFIGHVRAATIGGKTKENAHPFIDGDVVGVHNGTLKNWEKAANKVGVKHTDIYVDSKMLIRALSQDFDDKNYKILKEFEGAAALIWSSKADTDTMFVFRNKERPLFHGTTKHGLYMSSTSESLTLIGAEDIKSFPINTVFTIKNGIIQEESISIDRANDSFRQSEFDYNSYHGTNNANVRATSSSSTIFKEGEYYLSLSKEVYAPGAVVKLIDYRGSFSASKFEVSNVSSNFFTWAKAKSDQLIPLKDPEQDTYCVVSQAVDIYEHQGQNFVADLENGTPMYISNIERNFMRPKESYAECVHYDTGILYDLPLDIIKTVPKEHMIDFAELKGSKKDLIDKLNKLMKDVKPKKESTDLKVVQKEDDKKDEEPKNDASDKDCKVDNDSKGAEEEDNQPSPKHMLLEDLMELGIILANSTITITDTLLNEEFVLVHGSDDDGVEDKSLLVIQLLGELSSLIGDTKVLTREEFRAKKGVK